MSAVEFEFLIDGEPRRIGVEKGERTTTFTDGEDVFEAEVRRVSDHELLISVGGRTVRAHLARDGRRTLVSVDGREFIITEPPPGTGRTLEGDARTPEGGLRVKSPMPGKVIKLAVGLGDRVRKNQTLVIVEAMKMENEIQSPAEGVVKNIHVSVGEFVDAERQLVEVEPVKSSVTGGAHDD
jgi:glutaconyl-CoA/methylmalonyl-CoA decarboxylase subunit gamma